MVLQMKATESTADEAADTMIDGVEADLDATDERGVSADLVRAYLNGIGRTKLLTAEQEVDLAKRIEAGLFAEEQLGRRGRRPTPQLRADLRTIVAPRAGPPRTTCSRRTCGWWSASPSATPAAAWPSST